MKKIEKFPIVGEIGLKDNTIIWDSSILGKPVGFKIKAFLLDKLGKPRQTIEICIDEIFSPVSTSYENIQILKAYLLNVEGGERVPVFLIHFLKAGRIVYLLSTCVAEDEYEKFLSHNRLN